MKNGTKLNLNWFQNLGHFEQLEIKTRFSAEIKNSCNNLLIKRQLKLIKH
jgi:hypothetical protein